MANPMGYGSSYGSRPSPVNQNKPSNVFAGLNSRSGASANAKKPITPSINTSNVNTPQMIWSDFLQFLIKVLETVLEVTSLSANVQKLEDAHKTEASLDPPDKSMLTVLRARIDEAKRTRQAYEAEHKLQIDDLCHKLSVAMKLSQPKASAAQSPSTTPTASFSAPSPASRMPPPTPSQPASMGNNSEDTRKLREALVKSNQALETANKLNASLQASFNELKSSLNKTDERLANYATSMGKMDARLPGGWETDGQLATADALEALSKRLDALNTPSDSRAVSVAQVGSLNPYAIGGGVAARLSLEALDGKINKIQSDLEQHRIYTRELRASLSNKIAGHKRLTNGETGAEDTSTDMIVSNDTSFDGSLERRSSMLESSGDSVLRQDLNAEMKKRQELNKEVQEIKRWKDSIAIQQLDNQEKALESTAAWQEGAMGSMGYFFKLLQDIYENQLKTEMPEREE